MSVSTKTWVIGEDSDWILNELDSISYKGVNYQRDFSHSAQNLIQRNVIDSFTMIYKNSTLIAGGGTRPGVIIPDYGSCYMVAVRGFRIAQIGLRQEYFTLDTLLPDQIKRGKSLGYTNCAMTFNLHNERILNNLNKVWNFDRKILPEPVIVNGMKQWVYIF
jgi:hypothetical protein